MILLRTTLKSNHVSPIISLSRIGIVSPGRSHELQVRVSAPITGIALPIIIFSHGFGSSMDAYGPLVNYWAARGFVVVQPTFLDSMTISLDLEQNHADAVNAYLKNPLTALMWRYRVDDVKRILAQN